MSEELVPTMVDYSDQDLDKGAHGCEPSALLLSYPVIPYPVIPYPVIPIEILLPLTET